MQAPELDTMCSAYTLNSRATANTLLLGPDCPPPSSQEGWGTSMTIVGPPPANATNNILDDSSLLWMEDTVTLDDIKARSTTIQDTLRNKPTDDALIQDQFTVRAASYWDDFYKRNGARFFKDRHYLDNAFPELVQNAEPSPATRDSPKPSNYIMVEVGCGVGNSILPLLESNANLAILGVDFAKTAIDTLQKEPRYVKCR